MKATEFRIGNLMLFNNSIKPITSNNLCDIEFYTDSKIPYCKPIPLTHEWLLNFGFEKFVEHTPSFGHDDIYRKRYIDINGRYNQYYFRNILIESVHELQNLYFALTKEELKINENNRL